MLTSPSQNIYKYLLPLNSGTSAFQEKEGVAHATDVGLGSSE